MRELRRIEWKILVLITCLLIGWNYTAPSWAYSWSPYGTGDFFIFYLAGKSWLQGGNPYVNNVGQPTGFVYPPPSLLFYGLFSGFNFDVARVVWNITNLSMFAAALIALSLTIKDERRSLFISIAVLLSLTSYPILINNQLGQSSLLVASITILSLASERLKHPSMSAVPLSIGTVLKGDAVFLLIYFVLYRKDLRYLARYLVASLVIVGASLLVIQVKLYSYYILYVSSTLYSQYSLESSQSIIRLASLTGIGKLGLEILSLVGIGLFAIFSFFANSSRRMHVFANKMLLADAMFLMNVLVMLLLSPRSLIYPYVWAILPLALFLSALLMDERAKFGYLAFVGVGTFLVNAALSPRFLTQGFITLPLTLAGNLMLIICIIILCVRPGAVLHAR